MTTKQDAKRENERGNRGLWPRVPASTPAPTGSFEADALRRALAERDLLLREVHHRVKNNFQIVTSLLNIQANKSTNPAVRRALQDIQGRIRSMALLHESLYRADDVASIDVRDYIASLCKDVFRAYGAEASRVKLDLRADDVDLDIDTVAILGLILVELVSNSLKHAFPDAREGRVSVLLTRVPRGIELHVADDGVGLTQPEGDPKTLGLSLVDSLSRRLNASVDRKVGPGTETILRFVPKERVP